MRPAMPRFPKRVEIVDGESFSSWVRRLAGAHRVSTIDVVNELGRRDPDARRPLSVKGLGYLTREAPGLDAHIRGAVRSSGSSQRVQLVE